MVIPSAHALILGEAIELSTSRDIVYWHCEAPDHLALRSRRGNGGLTIHDGAWAYCDGAEAGDDHRWSATGGVSLESLVRWTTPIATSLIAGSSAATPAQRAMTKDTNGPLTKTLRKTSGVRRT